MTSDDRRNRPSTDRPGESVDPDGIPGLGEDEFLQALLGPLDEDRPETPEALSDQTIRKVQAELTSRDLIDLTTFVFLMRFCAPLLDLLAAFFGHDPLSPPESMSTRRDLHADDPLTPIDRNDPDE